ncbi:MAG: maleylpyruvate isomerase N-terminal domain-containing protein [Gordonia sp. (in: high G+C Gram-positive bacteria)]|uniref:maleylpyruvate isomerase N-terminal domain-containing protein n=1 Tax=Gordonia sp. (in: high G+C Gram-positive bacteria) TaxID=84139 RepID=UPI0039E64C6A
MGGLQSEIAVFTAAADWAGGLVAKIPTGAWSGPGLGDWNLRALVGHTSRALLTVEQYLAKPAAQVDVDSAAAYYEQTGAGPATDAAAVLQRGVDAGAALGDDPAGEFAAIARRVTTLLRSAPDGIVTTIVGGMRLHDYLPTRTFELAVHGLDIAAATGRPPSAPAEVSRRALDLAVELGTRAGSGGEILLALTGRGGLPRGFSVLP